MSKLREFLTKVVGPAKANADVRSPAADAGPSKGKAAPATASSFAAVLPALAAGAGTAAPALGAAGGIAAPGAALAATAIILGVPIAAGIIGGAGLISSANEKADPIDDEGANEGGVPVSSGFDGGAPDTERDPIPQVIPEGEDPAPDTDRVPKPGDPDFPKEIPKPPLVPTFSLEAESSVNEDGGLSPTFKDLTRFGGGVQSSSSAEGTGAENAPRTNEVAPATASSFAAVLPALVAGAGTAAPALGAAGGIAAPGAALAATAIILGVPIAAGIIGGAGLISSANENADPIDDEGANEGGAPPVSDSDAGPPTVPRNPEDERTPPTQRPDTVIPDEGLPPTQPIPKLNPEDERSPPTLPSPGTGFPRAPTEVVEAAPSVIGQGVEAIQGFLQGSGDDD